MRKGCRFYLFYDDKDGLIGFGNADGRVVLIDTTDWSVVRDFNAANGPIWSLVIMPGAESIIVAGLTITSLNGLFMNFHQNF